VELHELQVAAHPLHVDGAAPAVVVVVAVDAAHLDVGAIEQEAQERAAAAPSSSAGTAAEQAAPPTGGPILPSGPALPTSTTTYSYQYVDTPSKNISCILYDEGVGCSILERSYASSGMQDCPDREFSIVALAGRTEVRCGEEYLGQPGDTFHTLQYGETTMFSDYACTSQSKGMTCWNTITGRGFTISRKSLIRF